MLACDEAVGIARDLDSLLGQRITLEKQQTNGTGAGRGLVVLGCICSSGNKFSYTPTKGPLFRFQVVSPAHGRYDAPNTKLSIKGEIMQDAAAQWDTIDRLQDPEGSVEKFVFKKENAVAEAVLYRYPEYSDRTVICCSTQSGCPVGCRFCGAGDYFVRSFNEEEIVAQPQYLLDLVEKEHGVSHADMDRLQIMFMSMGEPLLNQERMVKALYTLHERYPKAALLISTSGPKVNYEPLFKAASEIPTVGLQFSVHESTDEARARLIPFKAKMTLEEIAEKGREFYEACGRSPFFNYCVHEGNSTDEDVARLTALFDPSIWESTISVICERDETLKAAHERQQALTNSFMSKMLAAGYSTRRFDPAGQDTIGGGCGQLHFVQDWFKNNPDKARPSIGNGLPIFHANDKLLPIYDLNASKRACGSNGGC